MNQETCADLLFDGADALNEKQSQVKQSHARYANAEVSSLLGKIEAYPDFVILPPNSKLDPDPNIVCEGEVPTQMFSSYSFFSFPIKGIL